MKNIRDPFVDTPEGFHIAVEDALLKLEDQEMNRKVKWPALLAAAVLVMIAATGFAAAGLVRGMVDWDGNLTPYDDSVVPLPTPTPRPIPQDDWADRRTLDEKMQEMLIFVPDLEYWEATSEFQGTGRYGRYTSMYHDMPSFVSAIEGFGDLNLSVPEGYELLDAEVIYDLGKIQKTLYSEESYGEITLRKYRIAPPTDEMRDGYGMRLLGEGDKRISVHVFVYPSYDEMASRTGEFYVGEDDQYTMLEIEGYERALLFERGDFTTIMELIYRADDGKTFTVSLHGNQYVSKEDLLSVVKNVPGAGGS